MRAIAVLAVLAGSVCLAQTRQAPRPLPPLYTPDLSRWRIEVSPELGGWMLDSRQEVRIKIVDPADPDPPREEEIRYDFYEGYEEDEASEAPEKTPEELRQERLWEEERSKRTVWRNRRLLLWFNGVTSQMGTEVGRTSYEWLSCQNGENRLEILEPDSGKRVVRTWWVSSARTRFMVMQVRSGDEEWGAGDLEILEPGGDVARSGRRTPSGGTLNWSNEYRHPTPPPGTYTVRWTGGYRGGRPVRIVVEGILDGGTDQERRWRFERLMLPGGGPAILGTIDIED